MATTAIKEEDDVQLLLWAFVSALVPVSLSSSNFSFSCLRSSMTFSDLNHTRPRVLCQVTCCQLIGPGLGIRERASGSL